MDSDKIIGQIISLENRLLHTTGNNVTMAAPAVLSETIAKISILLANLSEPLFQAELDYKLARAARFDRYLKEGEKRTVAESLIRYDRELIKAELEVERIRNFMKRMDSLIMAIQSHLRVKTAETSNAY